MRPIRTTALFLAGLVIIGSHSAKAADLKFVAGPIPPYAFEKDAKPDGVATRITGAIAAEIGKPFQIEFLPWQRAQTTAQEDKNIGIIPLSRTPEREALYKWVGPIVNDREVLMTLSSGKKAPASLDEAKSWSVCVLRGSPGEAKLKAEGFSGLYSATDTATCARMLAAKNVDAWSVAKLVAPYQFTLAGLDPNLLAAGAEVRPNDIYLGLSKDVADDVVAQWQKGLEGLRNSGKLTAIQKPFE
jgi:polar amino acid transport system substrate-binding protein